MMRTEQNVSKSNKQRADGWLEKKPALQNDPALSEGGRVRPRPGAFFFLCYQQLAVGAVRYLDWFSVNPDALPGYARFSLQAPGSFSRDPPERHVE